MIAATVMALVLAGLAPPDPHPADAPPTNAPVTDPPVSAPQTPDPAPSAVKDQQDKLDRLQQIYDQSCGNRSYAAYDDLCNQLSAQLREVRLDLDKLQREENAASRRPRASQPK